ncbi:NADPH:quinone oxidoreductase family protein [Albimonas sp. CAU 1670]|uniref:NADPH:quinone oxidoreductase family protein n=1 Tax=Albimonas sp. CAU 1670 TaxID=3032599 RepID=UPI0023DA3488|nr:NADPH:quinone oxidoreductase family protein [Albimonas sp. CAU 1670]MDF2233281.1 NADPH:quinone oxidoreductase family protein [Albimonas sp. CAU 1670]
MGETMRAVICESWRPYDEMELKSVPVPGPLAPGEVRIGVSHAAVSWATTLVVEGKYQRKPTLPFSPGAEVSGTVLELGEGPLDADLKVGDRVCAALDWGGYAEQVVVHSRHVYPIPEGLDSGPATAIPIGWMTAYGGLMWRARLQPGEKVLVHGACGGVGLPAVDIARAVGAEPFAVVRGEAKAAFLRERGVEHVIDTTKTSFRDYVAEATDGRGVDVVYDTVGEKVFHDSLRCLDVGGRHIVIGFVGGGIPSVPANILLLKNIHVAGFNMGQHVGWGVKDERVRWAADYRAGVEQLMDWWKAGRIAPQVHAVMPLEDFREGMRQVTDRNAIGRVLLTP